MITIEIGLKSFEIPETWDECTLPQLMGAVQIVLPDPKVSTEQRRQLLTELLIPLGPEGWLKLSKETSDEALMEVVDACTSFAYEKVYQLGTEDFEEPEFEWKLKLNLSRIPVLHDVIKLSDGTQLRGPKGQGLKTLTLLEFIAAADYYQKANKSETDADFYHHVSMLVASLWMEIGEDGKPIQLLLEQRTERAKVISELTDPILLTIYFWFVCAYDRLTRDFATLFKSGGSGSKKDIDRFGAAGLLFSLAEDLTQLDIVKHYPVYDALQYASYKAEVAKAMSPKKEVAAGNLRQ